MRSHPLCCHHSSRSLARQSVQLFGPSRMSTGTTAKPFGVLSFGCLDLKGLSTRPLYKNGEPAGYWTSTHIFRGSCDGF